MTTFRVDLELPELAVCKMLGNLRTFSARTVASKGTPFNRDGFEIDEDGFIGEYAFCKKHNLFFDITAKPRRGGIDCKFMGKGVDIKTTRLEKGRLIVKYNKDVEVVALAIFHVHGAYVTFPGYIMASDLFVKENQTGEFGESYVVGQNALTNWKEDGRGCWND